MPERNTYYWHYPHDHGGGNEPSGSMLMDGYKLIQYFRTQKVELYNIDEDISELKDLSQAMPERTAKMLEKLKAWQNTIPNLTYGPEKKSHPLVGTEGKEKKKS